MSRTTTIGIDIGTRYIKVVISQLVAEAATDQSKSRTSTKIVGTGLAESRGLRHGYVENTEDAIESLRTAVKAAEKMSGIKVRSAYLAVGGIGLASITSTAGAVVSRADLEVSELDMEKICRTCEEEVPGTLLQNRRILHSIPLSYRVDGKAVLAKTPLGMKGTRLEVKMLFITCLENHLADMMEVVEALGIEVVDVLASPLAASFITLTKAQKMAGAVLANIGAETTSIVVFENNIPISLEVFPIGSNDITNDIALGFKIPPEEAENIKIGSIGTQTFPKKKVDEVIRARLTDVFELIEGHLKKIGRNGLLPSGIFLTGGGAGIPLVEDLAKISLKLPARIASVNLGSDKHRLKDSTWAVAYGLCMLGFSKEEKTGAPISVAVRKWLSTITDWIKQFLP